MNPVDPLPNQPAAAIIDVGSNSIKTLVARREIDGTLTALKVRTIDARISAGISKETPVLSEEGMQRGIDAILSLIGDVRVFSPISLTLVATSAVRDAANGSDFCDRVAAATGFPLRILSGEDEANLIGRGLTCDPSLRLLRDFYVVDLGGGSLECLAYRDRIREQAVSLPLGCVRLTERFIPDPEAPISDASLNAIGDHTRNALADSGFRLSLPPSALAIGTGGTVTTARAILAERVGKTLADVDSILTVADLRMLLSAITRGTLEDRKRIPAMPAPRADVFPAALATLIAVAEYAGFHAFHNSLYNLRWGLADEALPPLR